MPNKKNITASSPRSGMNKSVHISSLKQGEYTHAKNSNFSDENGNEYNLQNEHSNLLASKFKDGFVVIGFKKDLHTDSTFFLLKNESTGVSEIGVIKNKNILPDLGDSEVECSECDLSSKLSKPLENQIYNETQVYETLLNDECNLCLNFSTTHPIKTIVLKNEKCGRVMYFTDNYNPPRYIELDNLNKYKHTGEELCGDDTNVMPTCVACEKMRIFKKFDIMTVTPSKIVSGGSLKMGTYEFLAAYCDESGNEMSRYFSITNPVSIFDRNNITMSQKDIADTTGYSISLKVENLDKNYSHYKVAVIQITDINKAASYFIEGVHSTSDNTVIYSTDSDKVRTSINKLNIPSIRVEKWKTVTSSNGHLFGNGITMEKRLNLQPIVNLMGSFLNWQSYIAKESLYEGGIESSKFKGYYRGETYPIGIRFITDGDYTPIFPFIGRPSRNNDKDLLSNSNIEIESIQKQNSSCVESSIDERWQLYDTSSELGKNDIQDNIEISTVSQVENKTYYHTPNRITYLVLEGLAGKGEVIIDSQSYPIIFNTDSTVTATDFITNEKSQIETNHPGVIVTSLDDTIFIKGLTSDYEEVIYKQIDEDLYCTVKTVDYLKSSGQGSLTLNLNEGESFTDLLTFINDNKNKCLYNPNAYDFCNLLDVSQYPETAYPDFDATCSPAPPILLSEEIEIVDIIGTSVSKQEEDFPQDYSKVNRPSICSLYKIDYSDGKPKFNHDFSLGYMYISSFVGSKVFTAVSFYRDFNLFNTSCTTSDEVRELNTVSSANKNYFFDLLGSDVTKSIEDGNTEQEMISDLQTIISSKTTQGDLSTGKFTDKIHKGALWFKASIDNSDKKKILNITSQYRPEEIEKASGYLTDINSDHPERSDWSEEKVVRMTIFENCSSIPLFDDYVNMSSGAMYKIYIDGGDFIIEKEDNSIHNLGQIYNNTVYISLDVPIIKTKGINLNTYGEFDYEEMLEPGVYTITDTTSVVTRYRNMPTSGCFNVVTSDILYSSVTVDFKDILTIKKQNYTATCYSEIPLLKDCEAVPFKYGDFSYTESNITYPDNKELYDSSNIIIKPDDLPIGYVDQDNSYSYSDYFKDLYAESTLGPEGEFVWKTDDLGAITDYRCRSIRHFKMPNNEVSPFMFENSITDFKESFIYPLGVTINEDIINSFLDIAVKNNIITEKQRKKINGYEIVRGDRHSNESILAKGITFDMLKYKEGDEEIEYSNYPFNDLGGDTLFYENKDRNKFISHPYKGERNNNWTFHSPETDYNEIDTPSILEVEGYMYGKSRGYFSEVKDHPEYVVLGDSLENLASTLATAEVIAEGAIKTAMALSNTNIVAGFTTTVFPGGIVASTTIGLITTLSSIIFDYARYKYEWLESFKNLGSPKNLTSYYVAEGYYNRLDTKTKQYNKFRYLDVARKLKKGRFIINNPIEGVRKEVNNIDREESLYISTGDNYPIEYNDDFVGYDNNSKNRGLSSKTIASDNGSCKKGQSNKIVKNVASMYTTLKNIVPSQYGEIGSIRWLTTGYYGDLKHPKTKGFGIFGGDVFISRHTLKRSFPLFLVTSMGNASRTPFSYKMYSNIGLEPRFYLNYEINNKDTSLSRPIPNKTSEYVFDCFSGGSGDYIDNPSKFYLYYHGLPSFLVESTINTNNRYSGKEPWNNFFPNYGDMVDYTQEVNNPIRESEKFYYNSTYSKDVTLMQSITLPVNYKKSEYDCRMDKPNGTMYSMPDNTENNYVDPWLIYKPLNMYEFKTSYGDLIDMSEIEVAQVLARFTNTSVIFNAVDTLVDDGSNPTTDAIGTGGIFARRPRTLTSTDLGHMGTQTQSMVSCEYGHFFVDASRGQVFKINNGGQGYEDISAYSNGQPSGMKHWFKKHLPFKILDQYPELDIDNPYNGVGITLGWDSMYKRVFITKKDYKITDDSNLMECEGQLVSNKQEDIEPIIQSEEGRGWTYEGIEGCYLKFGKDVEGDIEKCLSKLKFIVRYEQTDSPDINPPCSGSHRCNRAVFDLLVNGIVVGTVTLNNAGGSMDLENRPVGYHDLLDRYNELTLTPSQIHDILEISPLLNIELSCACTTDNCSSTDCHTNVSWVQVITDNDEILYSGCPTDNILRDFDACSTITEKVHKTKKVKLPMVDYKKVSKDLSWTISYHVETGKWASFFDFKPNYYVNHNSYFQTGINSVGSDENGLWSHLLTNKSFCVFYGKTYPWEVEIPVVNENMSKYLETVSYDLDVRRYHNDYDYYENKDIGFDEVVIWNQSNNSGKLKLDTQKSLSQIRKYPKTELDYQRILQSSQDSNFYFNYFYNRVKKEKRGLPLWIRNETETDKELNKKAISFYGKRVLERLRGDVFLLDFKSYETQHKKIFKIAKFKENLYDH